MTKLKLANGKTLTIADGCDLTETDEGFTVQAAMPQYTITTYPNPSIYTVPGTVTFGTMGDDPNRPQTS